MALIGSKVWEAAVLRTGNGWFQDWKALVPSFGNLIGSSSRWGPEVPRLGSIRSKVWEPLLVEVGAPGSKTGEPWVQTFQHRDWEASVPTFGSHWFLELGTAVPRPGSLGSNVWKPLVTSSYRTGTPGFQDWEALVRRFGNR